MSDVFPWLHLLFAILASWRLTELVTMDRISGPFRQRFPWYLWTCPRCVSVWSGIACTLAYVYAPWANWPLALAWLYLVQIDWRLARRRWREWTNTYERKPIAGGVAQTWYVKTTGPSTTGPADSCENTVAQNDVQDAVDAASSGDTVVVGSGSCTWTVTLNPGAKYLTLRGAGAGVTIITDGLTKGGLASVSRVIHWVSVTGGLTRITGFTFQGGTNADSVVRGMVGVEGNSDQVRIDHNTFIDTRTPPFRTNDYIRGVMDHNTFNRDSMAVTNNGVMIGHDTWGNLEDFGDNSWAVADTFGSSEGFYIEDNTFTSTVALPTTGLIKRFAIDGERGARVVVRFNTFTNHNFQFHGADTGGRGRSTRHYEVYNNTADFNANETDSTFTGSRGGVGHIFDNIVTQSGGHALNNLILPSVYRHTEDNNGRWGPWCKSVTVTSLTRSGTTLTISTAPNTHGLEVGQTNTFGFVISGANEAQFNGYFAGPVLSVPDSTSFTYAVADSGSTVGTGTILLKSPFDKNDDATGYPCLDQSGYGAGDLWTDATPPSSGPSGRESWPNQVLVGNYVWNNTQDGVLTNATAIADVVVENRDQYNSVAGGGVGTGATGIGRGPIASRPATCTTGVAYWATDEGSWRTALAANTSGRLYKCTATNTWTLYYTPYTYPHPLNTNDTYPVPLLPRRT